MDLEAKLLKSNLGSPKNEKLFISLQKCRKHSDISVVGKRIEENLEHEYECRGIEISSSMDEAKFTDHTGMVIADLKLPYGTDPGEHNLVDVLVTLADPVLTYTSAESQWVDPCQLTSSVSLSYY